MVGAAGWFAASAVLSGIGASSKATQDAQTEKDYYNSQIQNAQNMSVVADLDIITAKQVGRSRENASRLKFKHMNASVETGFAGRNVKIGGGSPMNIILSNNVIGAKDRETIGENTDKEVFGLQIQKFNAQERARIARNKASSIDPAARGQSAMMGSLLSSVGSFAMSKA